MAIITADIQHKPQQEIVRDVSMFQVASKSKDKKPKKEKEPAKESKDDQAVREYLQDQCNQIAAWCRNEYGANSGGGSRSSALKLGIQREITNYLMSINHPIAMKMLQEYKEAWKTWK